MTPRYSETDIQNALREAKRAVGNKSLTADQYRELAAEEDDWPTARTIINRYSDEQNPWMAALSDAGALDDPADHQGFSWGRYDAQNGIRYVAARIAAWPTGYRYRQEFKERALQGIYPSKPKIQEMYGTWDDAVAAARNSGEKLDTLITGGPTHIDGPVKRRYAAYSIYSLSVWGNDTPIHYLDGHEKRNVAETWLEANRSLAESHGVGSLHKNVPEGWSSLFGELLSEEYPDEWQAAYPGESMTPPSHAYSRIEVAKAVRQAADECGEPLSLGEYRNWAAGVENRPSGALLTGRHRDVDSWTEFCSEIGVQTPRGDDQ